MGKPQIFIASSTEGLKIAHAVQQNLEHDAECTVWTQGVFSPSSVPVDDLYERLEKSDFGVFIFSGDDVVVMRGDRQTSVRDNVLFETGMFVGRLSRKRSFIVRPRGENIHFPSDLAGMSPVEFDAHRQDGNLIAALGSACNQIRIAIQSLGTRKSGEAAAPVAKPDKTRELTADAVELLLEAANDADAMILFTESNVGYSISTNGREFCEGQDVRTQARWKSALRGLAERGLIDGYGTHDAIEVNHDGYAMADQLRGNQVSG